MTRAASGPEGSFNKSSSPGDKRYDADEIVIHFRYHVAIGDDDEGRAIQIC